ncbi:hypothetical protein SDC9_114104 [bioreactor metagenome]|uniref:Uncharacterized protein n=1 Tax=bioreactor metagenome TaxID=1076179 RepID=A0A645BPK4_9ZZZZ
MGPVIGQVFVIEIIFGSFHINIYRCRFFRNVAGAVFRVKGKTVFARFVGIGIINKG